MKEVSDVALHFSRAAKTYDQASGLQRIIGYRLAHLCLNTGMNFSRILDAGCGTGFFTKLFARECPASAVVGIDIAPGMVDVCNQQLSLYPNASAVLMDVDKLAFSKSFDLIFSNFSLQWSRSYPLVFENIFRSLRQPGLLAFSIPLQGSLKELRQAWQSIDGYEHVNAFLTQQQVVEILRQSGFHVATLSRQTLLKEYESLPWLHRELKQLGVGAVQGDRLPGLLGKTKFSRLTGVYESFRTARGLLPCTYEVLYCVARV